MYSMHNLLNNREKKHFVTIDEVSEVAMVEILVPDLHMTYNIYKTYKIDIISYA